MNFVLTLSLQFSAVNFVEELHPYERVEDNCVVDRVLVALFRFVTRFKIKYLRTSKQEDHDDGNLVRSMAQHVGPHSLGDHMLSSVDRRFL